MDIKIVSTDKLTLTSPASQGKYQAIIDACHKLTGGKSLVFKPELDGTDTVKEYRAKLSYKLSHVDVLPHTILSVRVTTEGDIAVSLVKGEHRKKGEPKPVKVVKTPKATKAPPVKLAPLPTHPPVVTQK